MKFLEKCVRPFWFDVFSFYVEVHDISCVFHDIRDEFHDITLEFHDICMKFHDINRCSCYFDMVKLKYYYTVASVLHIIEEQMDQLFTYSFG